MITASAGNIWKDIPKGLARDHDAHNLVNRPGYKKWRAKETIYYLDRILKRNSGEE